MAALLVSLCLRSLRSKLGEYRFVGSGLRTCGLFMAESVFSSSLNFELSTVFGYFNVIEICCAGSE